MSFTDIVVLTEFEVRMCNAAGLARRAGATTYDKGLGPVKDPGVGPGLDQRGCRCEYAASIAMNLYWRPMIGIYDQRDVGGRIEVRSGSKMADRLLIKPKDTGPTILVIEYSGKWWLAGWMEADHAKANYPLEPGSHSDKLHYVPQRDLWPVAELYWDTHSNLSIRERRI